MGFLYCLCCASGSVIWSLGREVDGGVGSIGFR